MGSEIYCRKLLYNLHQKGGITFFYTLNDHILQYAGTNLYLGVRLSEDLTFGTHVGNITKNGSRKLVFIQRNLKGSQTKKGPFLNYFFIRTIYRIGIDYHVYI